MSTPGKRNRIVSPHSILFSLNAEMIESLDWLARHNAPPGEIPNRSATIRQLIREEIARRTKKQAT